MQPILRKFRLLLSQLRGKFFPLCRVDYINGSDTFPPPLSKEEEQAVFARLHQGDTAARETLIVHNLRLVVYIAKKFESSGLGLEDLISIGTIGLIKAVETFCPDKKIKLATYASRCIENEILMVLRKNAQLRGEISIDEPLSSDWDGNELLLSDILGTDEDIVSRDIENEAEREMLLAAVSELGEREQEIMQMRFGLCGKKERTQKEVAEAIGISQSYISRLEKKIIRKLRKKLEEADQPIAHTTESTQKSRRASRSAALFFMMGFSCCQNSLNYSSLGKDLMSATKNFSRTTASFEPSSPLPSQSEFACCCALSSVTAPATALFSRTASVISTRPSQFTSPYSGMIFSVVVVPVVLLVLAVVAVVLEVAVVFAVVVVV